MREISRSTSALSWIFTFISRCSFSTSLAACSISPSQTIARRRASSAERPLFPRARRNLPSFPLNASISPSRQMQSRSRTWMDSLSLSSSAPSENPPCPVAGAESPPQGSSSSPAGVTILQFPAPFREREKARATSSTSSTSASSWSATASKPASTSTKSRRGPSTPSARGKETATAGAIRSSDIIPAPSPSSRLTQPSNSNTPSCPSTITAWFISPRATSRAVAYSSLTRKTDWTLPCNCAASSSSPERLEKTAELSCREFSASNREVSRLSSLRIPRSFSSSSSMRASKVSIAWDIFSRSRSTCPRAPLLSSVFFSRSSAPTRQRCRASSCRWMAPP